MKSFTNFFGENRSAQAVMRAFIAIIWLMGLFWSTELKAQYFNTTSAKSFISGTDSLVAYSDVPGLASSDKFTIRVRSAATNNVWVDVFAHYTYSRALEIPDINMIGGPTPGGNSSTSVQHYPNATAGWSQTYGNIEMSRNQPVEVEIAAKNGFKINGQDFFKATVHPAQKASTANIVNGKIYFIINDPVQVAIDINGQMDDHNAFVNPMGGPMHTITMFTNPIMKKPTLNNTRIYYVEAGTDSIAIKAVNPGTYDTIYFKPGVHNIGLGQKIYPGKGVYIPGDAILYGSLNNWNVPFAGFSKVGENITIFGYGTVSGAKHSHPYYVSNPIDENHKGIGIDNPLNYKIIGITVADPSNFSVYTPSGVGGFLNYVKVIGWRANGDGLGNGDHVNDCFVRTNDDCSYVRGNRKRVTYWKDNISAIFYMSQIWETTPILIEDCDVLYCRSRGGGGAAWDMRADAPLGQRPAQVTFRNIRFHDPLSNMEIFNLVTYKGPVASPTKVGGNYNWIKFENISIKSSGVKSNLLGCAAAPWNGGLTFDNVTYAGNLLTEANFTNYFNTNQYVNSIVFNSRTSYNIATTINGGIGGSVTGGGTFAQDQAATVSVTAATGYNFVNWTEGGVPVSTNLTYNFTVTQDRILVANLVPNSSLPLTLTSFNATFNDNTAQLKWTTVNELNVNGFAVEKRLDLNEFNEIGFVKANNNSLQNSYSFTDNNIEGGANYYRLRMVDKDGYVKYSQIVVLNNKATVNPEVFPNPAVSNLVVSHPKTLNTAFFSIVDNYGRQIKKYAVQLGTTQTVLTVSDLAAGNYFLVFISEGTTSVTRFLKQ